jgi:Leucine-rich repeat (LRR) protein
MSNLFNSTPQLDPYPFLREITSPVTRDHLAPLSDKCQVVQFNAPLSDSDHQKVAELLKTYPTVSLRVYAHYKTGLSDLSFLRHYPFIKDFQVDVYKLDSLDGIEFLPDDLEEFSFSQTKKTFSLKFLERFTQLKQLYIEDHSKDIEIISQLTNLEKLTLRSIRLTDLSLLVELKKLWWLAIKLGGTKDLSALAQMSALKYLELWMIRGLEDISVVSTLKNLQYLFLQDLKNVKRLPDFSECLSLSRIVIENLSELTDLSPLLTAANLEELVVTNSHNLQPSAFIPLQQHTSLKSARIGLGSLKKNNEVEQILNSPKDNYSKFNFKFV